MKSFLMSVLVLGCVAAKAEVKVMGTVLAQACGSPSKTLTVCSAQAVGMNQAYILLTTVKTRKEIPARGNDHYLDGLRYVLFWMDRKKFFSVEEESEVKMAARRERVDGILTRGPAAMGMSDPITGMPA